MPLDLNKLLRPHILGLKPYSSARDEYTGKEGVFLDANENSVGSVTTCNHNRYPDPYQDAVKIRLSEIKKVPKEQIFLGNGSDEAIDLLFRAFCSPGTDNVILLPPTYGMYEVSANINDVQVKKVNLNADFQLIPDKILEAVDEHTKIIFICSPNNPSGNAMERAAIREIITNFEGLVVIDEAYIDFSQTTSFTTELDTFPNLLVMQTFSKAWGLASLRIGMAYASKEIISILNKIKPPYNISGLAQKEVLEALEHPEKLESMVNIILKERENLKEKLSRLPIVRQVYPSDANFILTKITDAKKVYNELVAKRIIVRDRSNVTLCEECLRITVGTAEENTQLIHALESLKVSEIQQGLNKSTK
jgi:histidinol-phosphate aminotransferase